MIQSSPLPGQSLVVESSAQLHLQHAATDCTTTLSCSIIFLNDARVVAQSTTSTFHGKADAEKSSDKFALVFKGPGNQ
jgi:hypothetical protein